MRPPLVPFEEDEKDPSVWFLDHNYVESMNDMFKKVNAREKLIGWYHSGPKLRASDLEINELFKRYTPNPLLVIIDVQPKDVGVPTDAYFAVEEIRDVRLPASARNRLDTPNVLTQSRTDPPPPRRSYTHHPSLRQKRRKKSVSSTSYVTSETSPSALCQPASLLNSSPSKACITASKILANTSRRSLTKSYPSTMPSSAISKTSSTFCPTCLRQRVTVPLPRNLESSPEL